MAAPLAAEKTRDVLWHLGTAPEVVWYALAAVSVVVFAYGVVRPVAKYRRGRAVFLPPRAELPERLRTATRMLFSHASIERRDRYVGWAHRGIFYGFLVLFIGTVVLAINTDVTELIFGWRFLKGAFSPAGWVGAQLYGGLGEGTLGNIRHAIWWSHGLVANVFVASIPFTKAV